MPFLPSTSYSSHPFHPTYRSASSWTSTHTYKGCAPSPMHVRHTRSVNPGSMWRVGRHWGSGVGRCGVQGVAPPAPHRCQPAIHLCHSLAWDGVQLASNMAQLAFAPPPMCFDQACQAEVDRIFTIALCIPLIGAAVGIAILLRPVPQKLKDSGEVFEDPETGLVFIGEDPARDSKGELAYRAFGYTPWPVDSEAEGERVRVEVGPCKNRKPRTFVFPYLLSPPSDILAVSMPRPLGLVLEYDKRRKRTTVAELIEGSNADQRRKVGGLNQSMADSVILPGDVVRGLTCTTFQYPTRSLFGLVPPERTVVLFGADNRKFNEVKIAMRRGEVKDGEVTVVVERVRLK